MNFDDFMVRFVVPALGLAASLFFISLAIAGTVAIWKAVLA